LKAIRQMNAKLEHKCSQILKKWDLFVVYEEKTNEFMNNSNRLANVIEDLNNKLNDLTVENDNLKRNIEFLNNEKFKFENIIENQSRQVSMLKGNNDELSTKNNELENKFKRTLDQRELTSSKNNKSFQSNALSMSKMNNHEVSIFN
jgi:chromosome segregation ATPase